MQKPVFDPSQPQHAHADERLRSELILWFGSVRPDGRPHLVPVWFLWDDETILVFSKPDQKISNLRENRNVVLAVDDTKGGGDVIVIEGEATLLPSNEVDTSLPAYARKYAKQLASNGWTGESMARSYTEPIRVVPHKVRAYG